MKKDWGIFINTIFFVLGFSIVFSLVGVLLQSVFSSSSYAIQTWLGRIGGVLIILFGLYLLRIIRIPFLDREHKFKSKRFKSSYITSFVFGAAFAVGWTPCIGPILGAILTLAVTSPASAFWLMLSYSLGLGVPFLIVGFFGDRASKWISGSGKWVRYVNLIFGIILVIIGILVFTSQLSRIANLAFASEFLIWLNLPGVGAAGSLNIIIAFVAGIVSFLSPCILPLV